MTNFLDLRWHAELQAWRAVLSRSSWQSFGTKTNSKLVVIGHDRFMTFLNHGPSQSTTFWKLHMRRVVRIGYYFLLPCFLNPQLQGL